jgi:peptide/nickel transport system permease protein
VRAAGSSAVTEFPIFVVRRLAISLLVLVAISMVLMGIIQFMPGDAVDMLLRGLSPDAVSPETREALRRELGLDLPVWHQYWNWISGVVQGDFGHSYTLKVPVAPIILARLETSLILALPAIAVMVTFGVGLGVVAALKENSPLDASIQLLSLTAIAMPAFLVGSLFLYVFAVKLNWIPAAFNAVDLSRLDTLETIAFFFTALIFPCLTIAAETVAHVLRQTRASMIEEMKSNYVRAALLRGVPRRRVILGHVLRNSLLPAITVIAINVGYVFGGVIVVEFVFSYPGIGNLMLTAILTRDIPTMLGTMFVISAGYVLANFIADILYSALNPRVRLT